MNLYFLVEGKTEQIVYPNWISLLLPSFSRIEDPSKASTNNYFLVSGGGFPGLLDKTLKYSIEDVNSSGNYDFLIICLDSDNDLPEAKIAMVLDFVKRHDIALSCKLQVIVQRKCMETWFMGNRTVYSRSPSSEFLSFSRHYDVSKFDPELMEKPQDFIASSSVYHYEYLRKMLLEKRIRYSKKSPNEVTQEYYLVELKKRILDTPEHLTTLRSLLDFFDSLN